MPKTSRVICDEGWKTVMAANVRRSLRGLCEMRSLTFYHSYISWNIFFVIILRPLLHTLHADIVP